MVAPQRLKDLQSHPSNKTCVDCSQENPQCAFVSYDVFMCLECSGKHRGLDVHISFVRSVTMDSSASTSVSSAQGSTAGSASTSASSAPSSCVSNAQVII
ncbi:unnamed protein product [Rhodiola kirilowii]